MSLDGNDAKQFNQMDASKLQSSDLNEIKVYASQLKKLMDQDRRAFKEVLEANAAFIKLIILSIILNIISIAFMFRIKRSTLP